VNDPARATLGEARASDDPDDQLLAAREGDDVRSGGAVQPRPDRRNVGQERRGQATHGHEPTVVSAVGSTASTAPGGVPGGARALHVIGDRVKPRRILEAMREGFELAYAI
jgi:hypothetical protein